ncbi:hypothetical protein [Sinorhizobium terangae]|uniref:Uncharacterized protein n=1 Tax=Sinorhizobium terangae TaxID=110322 RepID=A0A6N7LJJ0_SINTE|nr:hypothetical protein [Sinorhizobium terangae]MBB4189152.1 hypothetical protein [Sinorhizobium terangae]MQX17947.1 hypothetical protein [Sinorhizobium terangae]WFU46789.1 hypothetical protein QA637_12940 [Sinorhizobium terangae]
MRYFACIGLAVAAIASGPLVHEANAQMRTGKGEYYTGVQRKPWPGYLFFWITGRDRAAALAAAESNAAGDRQPPRKSRKY